MFPFRVSRLTGAILVAAMLATAGCSTPFGTPPATPQNIAQPAQMQPDARRIKHVVVIVQENRSVDNLFNGLPGADTVQSGKNSHGQTVQLVSTPLTAPYDLSHKHSAWVQDDANGVMDGFDTETENCYSKNSYKCPEADVASYGYVPRSDVQPYWDLAEQYTFGDRMFQTSQGPSFSAHQYIVSATSAISDRSDLKAAENPTDPQGRKRQGGCDSQSDTTVVTIDPKGNEGSAVFPCFVRDSIFRLMNVKNVSWHYYQEFKGSGEWHAVDALKPIWQSRSYENVIWPSSKVLKDVAAGQLSDVTFVTPSAQASDHPAKNNGTGPSWVASIVNAIGNSQYWNSTAIFVIWDDWGGWYDHVPPTIYNSFEDGFRVPLLVISPYAKQGHVSHVRYEFGSVLKFIEKTFDLGSLGRTDVRSHDLTDCFDFKRAPRPFTRIRTKYSASYFENQPINYDTPDDDY
jgi:phospholipase C